MNKGLITGLLCIALGAGCAQTARGVEMDAPKGLSLSRYFQGAQERELAAAVCRGDTVSIQKYAGRQDILNAVGDEGMTPLLWGVLCESPVGVQSVLSAGADPNFPIIYRTVTTNALVEAAFLRNIDVVRALLDGGADVNSVQTQDNDPLPSRSAVVSAINGGLETGNFEIFKLLLSRGADLEVNTAFGYPIEYLVRIRRYDIVISVLEGGYEFRLYRIALEIQLTPAPELMTDEGRAAAGRLWRKLQSLGLDLPVRYRDSGQPPDSWPVSAITGLPDGDAIVVGGKDSTYWQPE